MIYKLWNIIVSAKVHVYSYHSANYLDLWTHLYDWNNQTRIYIVYTETIFKCIVLNILQTADNGLLLRAHEMSKILYTYRLKDKDTTRYMPSNQYLHREVKEVETLNKSIKCSIELTAILLLDTILKIIIWTFSKVIQQS